jgi:hypothetical protein
MDTDAKNQYKQQLLLMDEPVWFLFYKSVFLNFFHK